MRRKLPFILLAVLLPAATCQPKPPGPTPPPASGGTTPGPVAGAGGQDAGTQGGAGGTATGGQDAGTAYDRCVAAKRLDPVVQNVSAQSRTPLSVLVDRVCSDRVIQGGY